MADLTKKQIISEIANLIAFHKTELLTNIRDLGYKLPDESDKTIALFVTEKAGTDIRVAEMLATMIYNINSEQKSNIVGAIIGGVGSIVGGITGVFSEKEKVKAGKEGTKQAELMLEIEKQKTEQIKAMAGQGSKLSTGAKIGIGLGAAAIVTVILILVLRKRKVQA
jgi:hypothetical protein